MSPAPSCFAKLKAVVRRMEQRLSAEATIDVDCGCTWESGTWFPCKKHLQDPAYRPEAGPPPAQAR